MPQKLTDKDKNTLALKAVGIHRVAADHLIELEGKPGLQELEVSLTSV